MKFSNKIIQKPENCISLVKKYLPSLGQDEQRLDFIVINKNHKVYCLYSLSLDKGRRDITSCFEFQNQLVNLLKKNKGKNKDIVIVQKGSSEKVITKDVETIVCSLTPIISAFDVDILDYIVYNDDFFYSEAASKYAKEQTKA